MSNEKKEWYSILLTSLVSIVLMCVAIHTYGVGVVALQVFCYVAFAVIGGAMLSGVNDTLGFIGLLPFFVVWCIFMILFNLKETWNFLVEIIRDFLWLDRD